MFWKKWDLIWTLKNGGGEEVERSTEKALGRSWDQRSQGKNDPDEFPDIHKISLMGTVERKG